MQAQNIPRRQDIPTAPGVYRFWDQAERVIYVGKAKNLRQRLVHYFGHGESIHPRTHLMVETATRVDWTVVASEIEALTLEFQWIKEFEPHYNVMFRDDKIYPYLGVTKEAYPRVYITREKKTANSYYFGPYTQVGLLRETFDTLTEVLSLRTCSRGVFQQARRNQRPCLKGDIGRCLAPCVGRVSAANYQETVGLLLDYLQAKPTLLRQLKAQMRQCAQELEFEAAAKLRDKIQALEKLAEKNTLILSDEVEADFFALVDDEVSMAVYGFSIRAGRVRKGRGWLVENPQDQPPPQVLSRFLQSYYLAEAELPSASPTPAADTQPRGSKVDYRGSADPIPPRVYLNLEPADLGELEQLLGEFSPTKVRLSVPKRGRFLEVLGMVAENARLTLEQNRTWMSRDLTKRSEVLRELSLQLSLPTQPYRIECFDISHLQGTHVSASQVVFIDGLPQKDQYRRYNLDPSLPDDTRRMQEVLRRRFRPVAAKHTATKAFGSTNELGSERFVGDDFSKQADVNTPGVTNRSTSVAETTVGVSSSKPGAQDEQGLENGSLTFGRDTLAANPPGALELGDGQESAAVVSSSKPRLQDEAESATKTPRQDAVPKDAVSPRRKRVSQPGSAPPQAPAAEPSNPDPADAPAVTVLPLPDLVIVDGGIPQVNAAAKVWQELGLSIPLYGLAKRFELLYRPGNSHPLVLPRRSPTLYLLQQIRDESHRFAITQHRQRRSHSALTSELDSISGIGPVKQKQLLQHFGSLTRLKQASVAEIQQLPGFGPQQSQQLYDALHGK